MVILIGLMAQERYAQPRQSNTPSKQQNANAQPVSTPIPSSSPQLNNAAEAERERREKARDSKEDSFREDQKAQNQVVANATWWMAIFAGLNLLVAVAYAIFAALTLSAVKQQSSHAGNQVEKMQAQLEAMEEQNKVMEDTLTEMRKQSEAIEAQRKISETAIKIAERSALADEQNAKIALAEKRPVLHLSALVRRHDTKPEIFVMFENKGHSEAIVRVTFRLEIVGSEPFIRESGFNEMVVYPGVNQTARIDKIDPRQFDLVVRAGGGDLTLKIEGTYDGIGGPFGIAFCRNWVHGRDPHDDAINGECKN